MRGAAFLLLLLLASYGARAGEEAIALKPGPGQEATSAACITCHSLDYIPMNATFLTPDGWKAEVAKMRQAYGAPIDDGTAAEIVRYLSSNYAAPPRS